MNRFIVLFLVLFCSPIFGQGLVYYQDSTATDTLKIIPVSPLNPMPSTTSIGSITVDAFPVYADESGVEATATVDLNHNAKVNIASDTIGLVAAINLVTSAVKQPTDWQQQVISLSAGVAQTITSEIVGTRQFIIIKSQSPDTPFWISIDGTAVIGSNGTLVNDWIKLEIPLSVSVSVISSETLDLSIMEAGY